MPDDKIRNEQRQDASASAKPIAPPPLHDKPSQGPVDASGKPKAKCLLDDANDLGGHEHSDFA